MIPIGSLQDSLGCLATYRILQDSYLKPIGFLRNPRNLKDSLGFRLGAYGIPQDSDWNLQDALGFLLEAYRSLLGSKKPIGFLGVPIGSLQESIGFLETLRIPEDSYWTPGGFLRIPNGTCRIPQESHWKLVGCLRLPIGSLRDSFGFLLEAYMIPLDSKKPIGSLGILFGSLQDS